MNKTSRVALVALLSLGLLAAVGCQRVALSDGSATGSRTRVETRTVGLDGATKLDAKIRMGVGELTMSGVPSSTAALDSEFRYTRAAWKPELTYQVIGGTGSLKLSQPRGDVGLPGVGHVENAWDLKLAGGVPTDLSLELGVGTSEVNLRDVDVRSFEIITGVGESTIDLSGPRTADVTGRVEASIGAATIRLPRNVAVRVVSDGEGVGELVADGFTLQGKDYVNDAWGAPGPKIELRLNRGIGEMKLVLVD